jgi:hypothetical protein
MQHAGDHDTQCRQPHQYIFITSQQKAQDQLYMLQTKDL